MALSFISAAEIPYITNYPSDGRIVVIAAFYNADEKQWHAYSKQGPNQFLALKPLNYMEGIYVSKEPCDSRIDMYLQLTDLSAQYFSYPGILEAVRIVEDDFINALASIEKYFILLDYCNSKKFIPPMPIIRTELEYAFGNHRAFYDGIQKIVSIIYEQCHPQKPKFPDTFRKFAIKNEDELRAKYFLSKPLSEFYKAKESVFMKLREIRDNIFHHGLSPDHTFSFDDGFAIRIEGNIGKRLEGIDLWPSHLQKPNSLGSMLAILEFLVRDMLYTMSTLGQSILDSFQQTPSPIYPGFKFFLRSRLVKHVTKLDDYKDRHWFSPSEILKVQDNN